MSGERSGGYVVDGGATGWGNTVRHSGVATPLTRASEQSNERGEEGDLPSRHSQNK